MAVSSDLPSQDSPPALNLLTLAGNLGLRGCVLAQIRIQKFRPAAEPDTHFSLRGFNRRPDCDSSGGENEKDGR